MASEFDNIADLAGWRKKLDELLTAARTAAAQDDIDVRLEVSDRLTKFIVKNPPSIPGDPASSEYDAMDRIAREASDGLLLATIQQRVAAIVSRTTELAAIRKKIDSRTAANRDEAASIRLEKARRVVDATTEAVAAMTDLKKELEDAVKDSGNAGGSGTDFSELAKKIDGLISRIQSVRSEVETVL
jgi:hypothetical protein